MPLGRRRERGGSSSASRSTRSSLAEDPLRGGQRPVLAHERDGRGQQLHPIEAEARRGRRGDGVAEADEARRPGVVDHHVPHPRVAVGDAPLVQARQVRPGVVEDGVGDPVGVQLVSRRPGGLRTATMASSRSAGEPGRHHVGHPGAGAVGEEQHVGLVLDLVLAGQRQGRARSPCTRRSARAWRAGGRRCCRGRRPGSRGRRRARRCSWCRPTTGPGPRPSPSGSMPRSRRESATSSGDGVAAGEPKHRWARAAAPQPSTRLARTAPGSPRPARRPRGR